MGFRDETESLRGRIRELEDELREVRAERDRAVAEREAATRKRDAAAEAASVARRQKLFGGARSLALGVFFVAIPIGAILLGERACSGCEASVARVTGPDPRAAPSVGMLDLDVTPDPAALDLVATGDLSAPGACRGYVAAAPQIVVRSSHRVALRVTAEALAGGDLVALVMTADGQTLCDDDGAGSLNPLVLGVVPPGDTRVWIGTYSDGASVSFRLHVHADRADPPVGALATPVLAGPGPDVHGTYSGAALAVEPASASEPACRGYLPPDAALTLRLSEPAAVRLDATGADDLVLFVRESDHHVKCDDDGGPGAAPRIAAILPAGDHLVYVGTYSSLGRPAPYALTASITRVDPAASPTLGTRTLAAPGDTFGVEGRSSGALSPTSLGARCSGGLVPAAPHVGIELTAASDVTLSVASTAAPFVLVAHPDRTFECLSTGHTRVVFSPGLHRVYVGVADESMESDFTFSARLEAPTLRPWEP